MIAIEQKNFLTNFVAVGLIVVGYSIPPSFTSDVIAHAGYFALSGAITNWLAIYMLFERIPFLYGSGVIPNQFKAFKAGIKELILGQFFNQDNVERFLQQEMTVDVQHLQETMLKQVDYEKVYNGLVDAIMQSQFSGMLAMVGGQDALKPLKEPIIQKVGQFLKELIDPSLVKQMMTEPSMSQNMVKKIEQIVDHRLAELTPQMVKEIIQAMIRKHLGWLVVWGGVFGGLIGVAVKFITA